MILSHKIVHIKSVWNFIKTRGLAFFKGIILCCYILELFSVIRVLRRGYTLEVLNESAFKKQGSLRCIIA
jgi:hypothetical protein